MKDSPDLKREERRHEQRLKQLGVRHVKRGKMVRAKGRKASR